MKYPLQSSLIFLKRLIALNMISLLQNYMCLVLITDLLDHIAYRNNTFQVTKLGSYYSEILDIIFGVPHSELNIRSLLFYVKTIQLNFF